MIIYALIILIIIYLSLLIRAFSRLKKVKDLLEILSNYISSAEYRFGGPFIKKEKYAEYRNQLLLNYPSIRKFVTVYADTLSYKQSDIECYNNSISLYNNLMMKRNYLLEEFMCSFNPINSVKTFFCIPSLFIKWIGFKPNPSFAKILNLLCWILTYLLGIYSDEIKTFINSLFK